MTTQVPHRKLRREPWKFGRPQNIFATKRGPLKTLLAVHHKGIRVRKKAFQKARTDTMCLPLKIRERVTEMPSRQMIANRAESKKALARDPFHPDNRDIYCRKQLRYAAKPQEKRRVRCPPPRRRRGLASMPCRLDAVDAICKITGCFPRRHHARCDSERQFFGRCYHPTG